MKTSLRSILIIASFAIAAFFIFASASCRRDKCQGVVCDNGGICDGGVCFCQPGYEGATCDTIPSSKFIGNWSANDSNENPTAPKQYTMNIAQGMPIYNVLIYNFNNSFTKPVTANASGDSLIIPQQALQGKIVAGSGYYNNSSDIQVSYSITDSATKTVISVTTDWY